MLCRDDERSPARCMRAACALHARCMRATAACTLYMHMHMQCTRAAHACVASHVLPALRNTKRSPGRMSKRISIGARESAQLPAIGRPCTQEPSGAMCTQAHAWRVHAWRVHAWRVHAWRVHAWRVHARVTTYPSTTEIGFWPPSLSCMSSCLSIVLAICPPMPEQYRRLPAYIVARASSAGTW